MGRYYEDGRFQYFLQANECKKEPKTKVKLKKWLDTPDLKRYEEYITDWHYFLEALEKLVASTEQETLVKKINMYVLNSFYVTDFDREQDFYGQFFVWILKNFYEKNFQRNIELRIKKLLLCRCVLQCVCKRFS